MKHIKEFYAVLRHYPMNKKWMQFEFYFRQPFGLAGSAILFLITASAGLTNSTGLLIIGIYWIVYAILLFFVFKRERYSYACWISILVLDATIGLLTASGVDAIVEIVMIVLLIYYYHKRKHFFVKG